MAKAFQCDICNWYYKEGGKVLYICDDRNKFGFDRDMEVYDICPKCYQRLQDKFINYNKDDKTEQGSYDARTRRFTPYEDTPKEEPKVEEKPKPEQKVNAVKGPIKPKRLTCRGCKYLDSARTPGRGYQCNCLTNTKIFTEPSSNRCSKYEEG